MDGTFLGKIESVNIGFNDMDRFGPEFQLSFDGGSMVIDAKHRPSEYRDTFHYSSEEWAEGHFDNYRFIYAVMRDAKVREFSQLRGIPIEVTIKNNTISSWRVLTEVL